MDTRQPLVGGNWKMNTTGDEALELARAVIDACDADLAQQCDVCLFPPFTWLSRVGQAASDTPVLVGAQDVSDKASGAYTGQISAQMLLDTGCTMTLIGHSERRHGLGEPDSLLNSKVHQAIAQGLQVMLCVGEQLAQREAGRSEEVVANQVLAGLDGVLKEDLSRISVAYEPVWAIGTGRTASPEDAQTMHQRIRADLEKQYDAPSASGIRIVYGGSVKPSNADEIFAQPDVDGGLIGGASLDAGGFIEIVRAAASSAAS